MLSSLVWIKEQTKTTDSLSEEATIPQETYVIIINIHPPQTPLGQTPRMCFFSCLQCTFKSVLREANEANGENSQHHPQIAYASRRNFRTHNTQPAARHVAAKVRASQQYPSCNSVSRERVYLRHQSAQLNSSDRFPPHTHINTKRDQHNVHPFISTSTHKHFGVRRFASLLSSSDVWNFGPTKTVALCALCKRLS